MDRATLLHAWEKLPPLDRGGHAHAVVTARWGARQLAEWGHRESRLLTASRQVALVGDIAELLTGEQDLQRVLNRIVAETARVMDCPSCSLRLYDPKTGELKIKALHNLPPEYLGKGAVLRTASAVDDEALQGGIVYIEDARHRSARPVPGRAPPARHRQPAHRRHDLPRPIGRRHPRIYQPAATLSQGPA